MRTSLPIAISALLVLSGCLSFRTVSPYGMTWASEEELDMLQRAMTVIDKICQPSGINVDLQRASFKYGGETHEGRPLPSRRVKIIAIEALGESTEKWAIESNGKRRNYEVQFFSIGGGRSMTAITSASRNHPRPIMASVRNKADC